MKGCFTQDGVKGILEAKDYKAADMVFSILAADTDSATGYTDNAHLMTFLTAYANLLNKLLFKTSKLMLTNTHASEIESSMEMLDTTSKTLSGCQKMRIHLP